MPFTGGRDRHHGGMVGSVPDVLVSLDLDDSDRPYRLPGAGCRSFMFVFEGKMIGAQVVTADGRDLTPGSHHDQARLRFWVDEFGGSIREGSPFDVWYGHVMGHGTVTSVPESLDAWVTEVPIGADLGRA